MPQALLFVIGVLFVLFVFGNIFARSNEHASHHSDHTARRVVIFEAYNALSRGDPVSPPMIVDLMEPGYRPGESGMLNQYHSHLNGQGEWETIFQQATKLDRERRYAEHLGITVNFSSHDLRKVKDWFNEQTYLETSHVLDLKEGTITEKKTGNYWKIR